MSFIICYSWSLFLSILIIKYSSDLRFPERGNIYWNLHYYTLIRRKGEIRNIFHIVQQIDWLFTAPFLFKLPLDGFFYRWSMINHVAYRNPMSNNIQRFILGVFAYSMPYRYVRHKRLYFVCIFSHNKQ